ncbi:hypothetical protein E6C27_scaffold43G00180 [Cucumis melo var. makuwa]|uniref:Uncharacterized protein n=1 Tax=Cucumis melo var. makuwa TaxID=1194695 RepID=A0A5A7U0A4_CUCMM|nr:hypothetical protein E6C27_scaffold43G00180 [Cucumis melo var. makuwa]
MPPPPSSDHHRRSTVAGHPSRHPLSQPRQRAVQVELSRAKRQPTPASARRSRICLADLQLEAASLLFNPSQSSRAPPLPPPEPEDATRVRKFAVARSYPTRVPAATRPASIVRPPAPCPRAAPSQVEPRAPNSQAKPRLPSAASRVEPPNRFLSHLNLCLSPRFLGAGWTSWCWSVGFLDLNGVNATLILGPSVLGIPLGITKDQLVLTGACVARVRGRASYGVKAEVGARASWRATRSDRGEP